MEVVRRLITISLTIGLLAAVTASAAHRKRQRESGPFDYYLLALSYAPDFCDQPTGNKDPRECGSGRHIGFVVHGLWPQGENSRGPENCANPSPVSQEIIRTTLNYIPTESLIQHEWSSHGTCSGLSAAEFFAALRKARDSVKIPDEFKQPNRRLQLSPAEIESKFSGSNPTFPKDAFRVTCYRDGELQEMRICLSKQLTPRACGTSAGQCPSSNVILNAVR